MCVHEKTSTPQFKTLAQKMEEHGYVALTLSDGRRDYSMFVNPREAICVKRAYTDLRNWRPEAEITAQSIDRLTEHKNSAFGWEALCDTKEGLDRKLTLPDRNVPDSLDLDERNFEAVYARCYENGYFTAKAPLASMA